MAVEVAHWQLGLPEGREPLPRDQVVRLARRPPHVPADHVVQVLGPVLHAGRAPMPVLVERNQPARRLDGPPVSPHVHRRAVHEADAVALVLLELAVVLRVAHLLLLDALLAQVAVPGLAVGAPAAVAALLPLVAPVVAVDVAVAHLVGREVVLALAVVLVGVVLAVGGVAVAALRDRNALAGRLALELARQAHLVRVDAALVRHTR